MTRPGYPSAFGFARRKQQEALAKRKRDRARLKMLAVAVQVFSGPELVGLILSHIADRRALARLSVVCKLWSWEAARHLWDTSTQLLNLEHKVRPARQGRVASLIRHLHLDLVIQLWSRTSPDMPTLTRLRTLEMNAALSSTPFESPYMSRLLSPFLQELRLTNDNFFRRSPAFNVRNLRASSASWLRSLHQTCPSLRTLLLDIRLTPAAFTDLELFFLCSSLQILRLGNLLYENFDDWTLAIILAQQTLCVLELYIPITTESLAILRDQCNGLPTLDNLQQLTATFNVSAEKAMARLLPWTPNLTMLDVTIDHTLDGTPWSPSATAFLTIGQLKHLHTLHIRISTSVARDSLGERRGTGITGADLMAIARLPLNTLSIQPLRAELSYILWLREVTGSGLLHVFRRWQSLAFLELAMVCEEVVCDAQQEEEIKHLLRNMDVGFFGIDGFVRGNPLVDHEIWLGSNSNFCPDLRQWAPRHLYEPGAEFDWVSNDHEKVEDDLLVWGNGADQEGVPIHGSSVLSDDDTN
ncbi:hypothetical protein KCU76_g2044, partial [Aureobasidium melanogenum]